MRVSVCLVGSDSVSVVKTLRCGAYPTLKMDAPNSS